MNWELFISLKYLAAKRRERFISLISLISVVGIAVGVAALIVVISVMSGFDSELKDKIISINSHLVIESDYGMSQARELIKTVRGVKHVVGAANFVHGQVMIRRGDEATGVILKGIEPGNEVKVTKIGSYITKGSIDLKADGIVIGSELAGKLGVHIGDKITVISPVEEKGQELAVTGVFTSGMYEYDANLAYVTLQKAQELFGAKGLLSGVTVRVDDAFNAAAVKEMLRKTLGFDCAIRTWMDSNKTFLNALKLEKTVMFLILMLIVMVACFNIASTLIMTVLEKTKDIGILKAIGAANSSVARIFAIQGGIIGLAGTMLGAKLGIMLCWLLKTFKFITLPKDIYYIDRLPVKMEWREISIIIAASIAISFIATLYPSLQASRLDPVEALRYE